MSDPFAVPSVASNDDPFGLGPTIDPFKEATELDPFAPVGGPQPAQDPFGEPIAALPAPPPARLPEPEELRERAIYGTPGQQAVLPPQGPDGMASEEDIARRALGIDNTWRDIPVLGQILSGFLNLGAGVMQGAVDVARNLGWDGETSQKLSEWLGEPIQKHQERMAVAIQKAYLDYGLPAVVATKLAHAASDTITFILALKLTGGGSLLSGGGTAVKAGANVLKTARTGVAATHLKAAMNMGLFRLITTPGDWDAKIQSAVTSMAFRATPALSGQALTDYSAMFYDFLLNTGVSITSGQYKNAMEQGRAEAAMHGDEDNAAWWGMANLIPIIGSDVYFSAQTKGVASYLMAQAGNARLGPNDPIKNFMSEPTMRTAIQGWLKENAQRLQKAGVAIPQDVERLATPQLLELMKNSQQAVVAQVRAEQAEADAKRAEQAQVAKAADEANEAALRAEDGERTPPTPEAWGEVVKRFEAGESSKALAEEMGVPYPKVGKGRDPRVAFLKQAGVPEADIPRLVARHDAARKATVAAQQADIMARSDTATAAELATLPRPALNALAKQYGIPAKGTSAALAEQIVAARDAAKPPVEPASPARPSRPEGEGWSWVPEGTALPPGMEIRASLAGGEAGVWARPLAAESKPPAPPDDPFAAPAVEPVRPEPPAAEDRGAQAEAVRDGGDQGRLADRAASMAWQDVPAGPQRDQALADRRVAADQLVASLRVGQRIAWYDDTMVVVHNGKTSIVLRPEGAADDSRDVVLKPSDVSAGFIAGRDGSVLYRVLPDKPAVSPDRPVSPPAETPATSERAPALMTPEFYLDRVARQHRVSLDEARQDASLRRIAEMEMAADKEYYGSPESGRPELMAPRVYAERHAQRMLTKPRDGITAEARHMRFIRDALEVRQPVAAESVDAYKIDLPEGYVREGDRYVFKGEVSPTPSVLPPSDKPPVSEVARPAAASLTVRGNDIAVGERVAVAGTQAGKGGGMGEVVGIQGGNTLIVRLDSGEEVRVGTGPRGRDVVPENTIRDVAQGFAAGQYDWLVGKTLNDAKDALGISRELARTIIRSAASTLEVGRRAKGGKAGSEIIGKRTVSTRQGGNVDVTRIGVDEEGKQVVEPMAEGERDDADGARQRGSSEPAMGPAIGRARAGSAGTVDEALKAGVITAERVTDAISHEVLVRSGDTERAEALSNRLTEAGVGDLTRLTSEQLSDLYMRVVDGSWPRMQSISEGRALTADEAAQRVDAVVRGAGGTFTTDRTDSPTIGTAKIGGVTVRYVYGEPERTAAGQVRRTGDTDYEVRISPTNGRVTTVEHEAGHIVRDVLNPRERSAIQRVTGLDLSTREGDEAFATRMQTAEGRKALAAEIAKAAPADRAFAVRAINKIVDFINAVFGTKMKHIGNAGEFERLAEGLTDFSLLRRVGQRGVEPRTETGARAQGDGAVDWQLAETGKPITLNGWRGEGAYGGLTPEQAVKFGREFLLGAGAYIAPTKRLASAFGEPRPVSMTLKNPYVIVNANGASLRSLDLDDIKAQGHDGIVIVSGQWGFGAGQEGLKQAVRFDGAVSEGHAAPPAEAIVTGQTVRITNMADSDYNRTYRADALSSQGKEGKVVRLTLGNHPVVRIGNKNIQFNTTEVAPSIRFQEADQPQTFREAVAAQAKKRMEEFNEWRKANPDAVKGMGNSDAYQKFRQAQRQGAEPVRPEVTMPDDVKADMLEHLKKMPVTEMDPERRQATRSAFQRLMRNVHRVIAEWDRPYNIIGTVMGPKFMRYFQEQRFEKGETGDRIVVEAETLRQGMADTVKEALNAPVKWFDAVAGGDIETGDGGARQQVRLDADEQMYLATQYRAGELNADPTIREAPTRFVLGASSEGQPERVFHMTREQLRAIHDGLTPAQRTMMDEYAKYMDTKVYDAVNAEYQRHNGKPLPKREFYAALHRDYSLADLLREKDGEGALKLTGEEAERMQEYQKMMQRLPLVHGLNPNNAGFLKTLRSNRLPIVVRGLSEVFRRSTTDAAQYVKTNPLRDMIAANILNNEEVKRAMRASERGELAYEYMRDYHDKMGGVVNLGLDATDSLLTEYLGPATTVRLASPWVAMKQVMSAPAAAVYFGAKYLRSLPKLFTRDNMAFAEDIISRSSYFQRRFGERHFDVFFSDPTAGSGSTAVQAGRPSIYNRAQKLTVTMMGAGDRTAIKQIIMMARDYVIDTRPDLKGDAFKNEVARQAAIATMQTQVATDALDRTMIERNITSPMKKLLTYMYGARGAQFNALSFAWRMMLREKTPDSIRSAATALFAAGLMQAGGIALIDTMKSLHRRGDLYDWSDEDALDEKMQAAIGLIPMMTLENVLSTVPILGGGFASGLSASLYQWMGEKDAARLRSARVGQGGVFSTAERDFATTARAFTSLMQMADDLDAAKTPNQRRAIKQRVKNRFRAAGRATVRTLSELFGVPVNQVVDLFPSP